MFFGYSSVLLTLVRNVFLVPVYLRHINIEEYGAWLATGGTLIQLLISDYGLSGVVTQRAALLYGASDLRRLGSLLTTGMASGFAIALVLSLLSLALSPMILDMKGLSGEQAERVAGSFLLAVGANALAIVAGTATGILRGLQRPVASGITLLVADLANVAITVWMLFEGWGLYALAGGMLIRSAINTLFAIGYGLWICLSTLQLPLSWSRSEAKGLLRNTSHTFAGTLAMKLQTRADTFFVGAILGPQSAAVYGMTVRAHETVLMFLGQINTALGPSMAHLYGSGNLTRFRDLLLRLAPALAAITALGMGATVAVNEAFVGLWVGDHLFGGQSVSTLMAAALFVASIGYVAYDALIARGDFRSIAAVFTVTAMLHIVLLFALLPYGIWGAPAAACLSGMLWGALFWHRVRRTARLSQDEIKALARDFLMISGVGALAAYAALRCFRPPGNWYEFAWQAAITSTTAALALFAASARLRRLAAEELSMSLSALRRR